MENVLGHYDNFYTTICETDNLHEEFTINNHEYLDGCNLPLSDTSDDNVMPNIFVKIPLHCQNNNNNTSNVGGGVVGGSNKQNNDLIKSEPIKSEFTDSKTTDNNCTTIIRNNNKGNFSTQRDSLPLTLPSNDLVTARPKTNQIPIIKCYKCTNCLFLTISNKTLEKHYKNMHKNRNEHKKLTKLLCPGCENIFYTKNSLENHLINDHHMINDEIEILINYTIKYQQNTIINDDNLLLNNNNERLLINNHDNVAAAAPTIDLTLDGENTMKKIENKGKTTRLYIKNVNILKKPNLISPSTTPQPLIAINNNNNNITNDIVNDNNNNTNSDININNQSKIIINNDNDNREIINETNLISYNFPIISTNSFENHKQQQQQQQESQQQDQLETELEHQQEQSDLDDNNIDKQLINEEDNKQQQQQQVHTDEQIIKIKPKDNKQSKIFIKNVDILKEPKYNINFINNNNNLITTIPPTRLLQSINNNNNNNLQLTTINNNNNVNGNTDDYYLSQNLLNDNQYQTNLNTFNNLNNNNNIIINQTTTLHNNNNNNNKRVKKNYKIKKKCLIKEIQNKYIINDINTMSVTAQSQSLPITPATYIYDDLFNNVVIDQANLHDLTQQTSAATSTPIINNNSTIFNENINNNLINNNNDNNIIILDDNNIEDLFLNNNHIDSDVTSSNETITNCSIDTNLDLDLDKSTIINDNNSYINYNNQYNNSNNNNNNYIFYDNYINQTQSTTMTTNLIDQTSINNYNFNNHNHNDNYPNNNNNNLYNYNNNNNENDITVIEEEVTSTTFNEKLNINTDGTTRIRETDKDILFICAEEIINSINVINDNNNDIKINNNNNNNNCNEKGRIYVVNNLLKETTSIDNNNNIIMPQLLTSQSQLNTDGIISGGQLQQETATVASVSPSSNILQLKKVKKLTKKGSGRLKGSRNSGITKLKKNKINITPELIGHKCLIIDCGIRFLNIKNLNLHYKCHLNEKIICPECNYNQYYSNWNTLHTHLWRSHNIDMELYSCNLCNFKTPLLARLKNIHLKIHSNVKNYKCNICENTFKNIKQLKNHRRIHNNNNNTDNSHLIKNNKNLLTIIKCEQCSSIFTNRNVYKQHIKDNHNKMNEYFCKKCKYQTNNNLELKKHNKKMHINVGRYKCDNCNHTTSDHNAFRRHKLTHNPTKVYNCPYCSYTAIQSIPYRDHILRKHADQAPNCIYKCEIKDCKFVTINKKQYDVHMMKHERINETNTNNIIKISDDDQECNNNNDKTDNQNDEINLIKNNRPKLLTKIKLKLQNDAIINRIDEDKNLINNYLLSQDNIQNGTTPPVQSTNNNNNNEHNERLPLIRPACFANNFSHIANIKLFNKNYDNSKILKLTDRIEMGQEQQQQQQHQQIEDNYLEEQQEQYYNDL